MAVNIRFKIEGIEAVRRVFREVPEENLQRITHALNQGADEIADRARTAAPKRSRELAGSVGTTTETVKVSRTGIRENKRGNPVVYVVAGTPVGGQSYARVQEFGRRPGPAGHPGHRPQPFMFPAYFSIRNRIRGRIKRAIKAAAKAVVQLRNAGRG